MCVCVVHDTQRKQQFLPQAQLTGWSLRDSNWIFVYYLETVRRRAHTQAYLCTHSEHSRFTTCTRRHTVCANRTIMRQLLTARCMRCPAGRCHALEGRTGVCLSEAEPVGFVPGAYTFPPPVSYHGGPGSFPGQSMWDFWWTEWLWDKFWPCQLLHHQCSIHLSVVTSCSLVYRAN